MAEINQPKNQKPSLKTPVPGPKSQALRQREDAHLAPGLQNFALVSGIVVDHARGNVVTDVDGNEFLDIIGGIGVNGLGHSHPRFVKAIQEQVAKASVGSFTNEPRVEFLERLAPHLPQGKEVYRTQLYSSGAEAVESALRLAKSYTGKYEFVSFGGGFHGKTMGVLSLMGSDFKNGMGPFAPGSHIVPYANCYRCPLSLEPTSCGAACAEMARTQIKNNASGKVAAIIIEPMQGTAGNVIPPDDFLKAVSDIAKENDALFISDEMITGFGRTGKFWGHEHSGVKPDILTVGKQFAGGMPVSAVIVRDSVSQAKPWSNPSGSSSSYGGNPLASKAAATALEIIESEKLVENSREMGAYFLKKIADYPSRYPFVGETRGRGLFLAIEFVKDQKTKEPLSKNMMMRVFQEFLRRGLLTMAYTASFRLQPPMTIDAATIDNVVAIFEDLFDEMKEKKWWLD